MNRVQGPLEPGERICWDSISQGWKWMWQGLDHGGMMARYQVLWGRGEGCEEGTGKACVAAEVGVTFHMATVENDAEPG